MTAHRIDVEQRSDAWLALRRTLITATDIGAILGLSPWKSEADVAADKAGAEGQPETLAMRKGTFMEPFILDEYQRQAEVFAYSDHGIYVSDSISWAGCSPDGFASDLDGSPRWLIEAKHSGSRSRWADGLPRDYEAQVRWSLGVLGLDRCDVAALVGDTLTVYTVEHDEGVFADLVASAADFRRRMAEGGPFAQSGDSARRAFPQDNGAEVEADAAFSLTVAAYQDAKRREADAKSDAESLRGVITGRIGEFSAIRCPGYRVTWKKAKDSVSTDWAALAADITASMPEPERAALVGRFTTAQQGARYLRVVADKEE